MSSLQKRNEIHRQNPELISLLKQLRVLRDQIYAKLKKIDGIKRYPQRRERILELKRIDVIALYYCHLIKKGHTDDLTPELVLNNLRERFKEVTKRLNFTKKLN